MQVPGVLVALQDQGVIDRVLRPLKSGKEAEVFLIESDGELRVAKVYKSLNRTFKQRAMYTEGRKVRNTRDQRAMDRRTRHGKKQEEDAWKSAEVDIIHRLHAAGIRVPTPYNFIDGVLIMELVTGADGGVAPRLAEVSVDSATANAYYQKLLQDVVRMLCAGVIHGDLSDYNVLVDENGPVVIDFPQAVDAAANRNAKKLLLRDVANLGAYLQRMVPGTRLRPYGEEIWAAFESNELSADMRLAGDFRRSTKKTDVADVLGLIGEADDDEKARRGEAPASPRYRRMQVVETAVPKSKARSKPRSKPSDSKTDSRSRSRSRSRSGASPQEGQGRRRRGPGPAATEDSRGSAPRDTTEGEPKRRRRRRRRGPKPDGSASGSSSGPSKSTASPRSADSRSRSSDSRSRSADARSGQHAGSASSSRSPSGEGDGQPRRRRRRRRGPRKPPED